MFGLVLRGSVDTVLLYTILYLSFGTILALVMTIILKNEHLLDMNDVDIQDKEEFDKLKTRYHKQSFLVFGALVIILPVFLVYDVFKLLLKMLKLVYNSIVVLVNKLFKGKK